jgi:hypothetical protein
MPAPSQRAWSIFFGGTVAGTWNDSPDARSEWRRAAGSRVVQYWSCIVRDRPRAQAAELEKVSIEVLRHTTMPNQHRENDHEHPLFFGWRGSHI